MSSAGAIASFCAVPHGCGAALCSQEIAGETKAGRMVRPAVKKTVIELVRNSPLLSLVAIGGEEITGGRLEC
jgi:hypothetical protein